MTIRTQPIFAGIPSNQNTIFPAEDTTKQTVFTAAAEEGSLVKAINAYFASSVAVTFTIESTVGAVETILGSVSFTPTAGQAINLLSSQYLPFVNDADPAWPLAPGQSIAIDPGSFNSEFHVSVIGAGLN